MLSNRTGGSLGRGGDIQNALRAQTLSTRAGPKGNSTPAEVGFDRTIESAVIVGVDASLVVKGYISLKQGGSLTLKEGAGLSIL